MYDLETAIRLVKETANARFDETIEVAINLGIDPKQSDQQVRGAVSLPHGVGKSTRFSFCSRGKSSKHRKQELIM